jgi:hypothetical protein
MTDFSKRLDPLILPAIVALVGLSAFGLGRLSVSPGDAPRLVITAPAVETQAAAVVRADGRVVASKSGSKYYLPTCSGATRIKAENKVWFSSVDEAKAAGYEAAANCPGI